MINFCLTRGESMKEGEAILKQAQTQGENVEMIVTGNYEIIIFHKAFIPCIDIGHRSTLLSEFYMMPSQALRCGLSLIPRIRLPMAYT